MIRELTAKYFTDLMESFENATTSLKEVGEGKEERALAYGNGRPVYLSYRGLSEVRTLPIGMHLSDLQRNLEVYEVKPEVYEYDKDLLTVQEIKDEIKVTFADSLVGTVKCNGKGRARKLNKDTSYILIGKQSHTFTIVKDEETINLEIKYTGNSMYSLLDIIDILVDCIDDDYFYGITTALGDQILHVSHPMVLQGLLENINDPEELIFDNTWLYRYKSTYDKSQKELRKWNRNYQQAVSLLSTANEGKYTFEAKRHGDYIHIDEQYRGSNDFFVTVPVQIAYSGHVSYPYYGLEHVVMSTNLPVGIPFWPITSPNVDTYNSWEICTGTKVKTLEGVSMIFNGNFASTFPVSKGEGTFRQGWAEAIHIMLNHTKEILNTQLGTTIPITRPAPFDRLDELQDAVTSSLSISNIRNWERLEVYVKTSSSIDKVTVPLDTLEVYIKAADSHLRGMNNLDEVDKRIQDTDIFAKSILASLKSKNLETTSVDEDKGVPLEPASPNEDIQDIA